MPSRSRLLVALGLLVLATLLWAECSRPPARSEPSPASEAAPVERLAGSTPPSAPREPTVVEAPRLGARPRPGTVVVAGTVRDLAGGTIAGAEIQLRDHLDALQATVMTDDDGAFRAWVPAGPFEARVAASGYAAGRRDGVAPDPDLGFALVPAAVLAGVVVAADGHTPLAGARVQADADGSEADLEPIVTGEDGRFRFDALPPGRYTISARSAHARGVLRPSIGLGLAAQREGLVVVTSAAVRVRGHVVVDTEQGRSCTKGFVMLAGSTGDIDTHGEVVLDGVAPGHHDLRVACEGHLPPEPAPTLEVRAIDLDGLRWIVSSGLTLRGEVVDGRGTPIAGAELNALGVDDGSDSSGTAVSDEDGAFVMTGLRAGLHALDVEAPGFARSTSPRQLDIDGIDDRVRLVLDAGAVVRGRVLDRHDRPLPGITLSVADGTRVVESVVTRDDGRFEQRGLRPGEISISVIEGWGDAVAGESTAVTAGTDAPAEVVLHVGDRDREIRGVVVDADGGPVDDAFVHAVADGGSGMDLHLPIDPRTIVLSDVDGAFTIRGLRDTTYTVVAQRRGGDGEAIVAGIAAGSDGTRLQLQPLATVAGHVVGRDDASAVFEVLAADFAHGVLRTESFVDDEGGFRIDGLPAGRYTLSTHRGEHVAATEVVLEPGSQVTDLRLDLGAAR